VTISTGKSIQGINITTLTPYWR